MKYLLTTDEAIALLPEGETIHTFMSSSGGVLVGADWDREEIIKLLSGQYKPELSGPSAKSMKHGIAVFRQYTGNLFIETNMDKLAKLESEIVNQLQPQPDSTIKK